MPTITVTRTYQDTAGVPASGSVSFTPVVSAPDGGSIQFLADPVVAPVSAGQLLVTLVTTDTFVVAGTVTYRVVERVGQTFRRRFYVALPSSLGPTVDLGSLVTTAGPPNTILIEGGADLTDAVDELDARLDVLEAMTTLAEHTAAADPHPVYLTADEANALYALISRALPSGGGTAQALVKNSPTDYDVAWADQEATAITSPFAVVATSTSHVPITAQGMAGQTADLLDAKQDGGAVVFGVTADGRTRIGASPPSAGTVRVEQATTTEKGVVVKQKAAGTAAPIEVQDSAGVAKFSVGPDGLVVAPNVLNPLLVLANAAPVPGGTPNGTVIMRLPA